MRWLRDELKILYEAADSEYFARKVTDSAGVYVVPAFSGLGAPVWDMRAKGSIFGLTAGTGNKHIIRAALESIAYQTEDVVAAMNADVELFGGEASVISVLKVDGGASANDLLMQMQSDFSALTVEISSNPEATAQGTAFLAGLAVGFFADRAELKRLVSVKKSFEPRMSAEERAARLDGWHRAVAACRMFSEKGE
jgi:glycerol kinase